MVQAANEVVVVEGCELTELHETSTVHTTVYGSNTVQMYVQSLSCLLLLTVRPCESYVHGICETLITKIRLLTKLPNERKKLSGEMHHAFPCTYSLPIGAKLDQ